MPETFDNLYKTNKTPWRVKNVDLNPWLEKTDIYEGCAVDLGCGTGEISGWLTTHNFNVEGLDISPSAIETAKVLFPKTIFTVWDLNNLSQYPFLYKKYDLIIDAKTFRSIEKKNEYLNVIAERLKGVFIMQIFTQNNEKPFLAMPEAEIENFITPLFNIFKKDHFKNEESQLTEYFLKTKK